MYINPIYTWARRWRCYRRRRRVGEVWPRWVAGVYTCVGDVENGRKGRKAKGGNHAQRKRIDSPDTGAADCCCCCNFGVTRLVGSTLAYFPHPKEYIVHTRHPQRIRVNGNPWKKFEVCFISVFPEDPIPKEDGVEMRFYFSIH